MNTITVLSLFLATLYTEAAQSDNVLGFNTGTLLHIDTYIA